MSRAVTEQIVTQSRRLVEFTVSKWLKLTQFHLFTPLFDWKNKFCNGKTCKKYKKSRLRVVPNFSSGIVERAKRERAWKSPHARKGDTRRGERKMRDYRQSPSFWPFTADWFWSVKFSPHRVSPFLAWGDFHARSRFARSTIPEEKWGTTRSLQKTSL